MIQLVRRQAQRLLFRYGWDTRCRNLVPAQMLRSMLADESSLSRPILLDVGSGHPGLAAFLGPTFTVGLDVKVPSESVTISSFVAGSATALPFRDRSFPVVTCIDVLEHLACADRDLVIEELARVTQHTIVIACPHGQTARDCDQEYRYACERQGRPIPDWLEQHLQNAYPVDSEIAGQLKLAGMVSGRVAKVTVSYCEPKSICRLVRAAAARSTLLYTLVNLFFGLVLPILPAPVDSNSYRVIVLATFTP